MLITLVNRYFLKRYKHFFKLWKTLLFIERSFSAKTLKNFRNQYAVCLPNKSTSDACLLTIKEKEKSKAFIRYSTMRNWKVRKITYFKSKKKLANFRKIFYLEIHEESHQNIKREQAKSRSTFGKMEQS